MQKAPKEKRFTIFVITAAVLLLFFNLLTLSRAYCDFYADHIYPHIASFIAHITGRIPFALGEILMYLAALLLAAALIMAVVFIFLRKKAAYRRFFLSYLKSLSACILIVLLLYTLNWITPYRSSVLGDAKPPTERVYGFNEIRLLYFYVVDRLNEACLEVPRDAQGNVIYDDRSAAEEEVAKAMNGISDKYVRLKGYYPPIKYALCSDVLNWMFIGGYTYPYTFETTCNKYNHDLYFPTLYAHECSHHKGYYKEHEANFLSFLACSSSDDPVLRYSAYLYIYCHVFNDYYLQIDSEEGYEECEQHAVLEQVWIDERAQSELALERYDEDPHPLEEYSEVAEDISDVGWETQSQILQEYDYDYVVKLLLEYYDGTLY